MTTHRLDTHSKTCPACAALSLLTPPFSAEEESALEAVVGDPFKLRTVIQHLNLVRMRQATPGKMV